LRRSCLATLCEWARTGFRPMQMVPRSTRRRRRPAQGAAPESSADGNGPPSRWVQRGGAKPQPFRAGLAI
jgi:hypothetical protein